MIRQILIAKTVDDQNIVLQTADGVDGINEIREFLKTAATQRSCEVTDPAGEVKECLYLEHWHRDGGVSRVVRLKTKDQLAAMAEDEAKRVAAQKAELEALPAIGDSGTTEEEPGEPEATEEEPGEPEATEEKPKRRGRRKK